MRNAGAEGGGVEVVPKVQADILVSIVNYRTAEMTLDAVRSVLADKGDLSLHVAVVDNDSQDGSAEHIAAWIAEQNPPVPVTLVRSDFNRGFSGGHNQGIAAGKARFYLILNSDAALCSGCLAALLAKARTDPTGGIIAPRLVAVDGSRHTNCFRYPTPMSEIIRGACSGPVTRALKRFDVALGPDPDVLSMDWVSFAAVMIRREVLDALGPMDEGYFLYFEDADYCQRARAAGWAMRYEPNARVVHLRGGSSPVKALAAQHARLPAYFYAARTRFFYRTHGRAGLLAANVCWHLGRGIAHLRPLFGKAVRPGVAAEWRDIWTNFLDPLGDRRAPEG